MPGMLSAYPCFGEMNAFHVLVCGLMRALCEQFYTAFNSAPGLNDPKVEGDKIMSPLGLILVILLVIFLLGGFSGRFGGYGYGYGHGGVGVIGVILIVIVVLMLLGRI
jgi:hypothetical protein